MVCGSFAVHDHEHHDASVRHGSSTSHISERAWQAWVMHHLPKSDVGVQPWGFDGVANRDCENLLQLVSIRK